MQGKQAIITKTIPFPKQWQVLWTSPLKSWQAEALTDFRWGNYLIPSAHYDHDPPKALVQFTRPLKTPFLAGSIVVSGAVGIGKSTFLWKVFDELKEYGFDPFPFSSSAIKLFYSAKHKRMIVLAEDFSVYIDEHLRDIPPSAHFHAQVFYSEIYRALNEASYLIDVPWLMIWDRFPIENIAFAQSDDYSKAASTLFREFWPTRTALDGLHSLKPQVAVFPYWAKFNETCPHKEQHGGGGCECIHPDNGKRTEFVKKRDRCRFEIDTAETDPLWFYTAAIRLYREIDVPCVSINLHDPMLVKNFAIDLMRILC